MKIHKITRLNRFELLALSQAFVLLWTVRVGLFLLPFPIVRGFFLRFTTRPPSRCRQHHALSGERIIWAVKTASRFVLAGGHCLTRAIVAKILLQQVGYESTLRIGVCRGKGQKLAAHAWLENEGRILIGTLPNLSIYTPLLPHNGDFI